MARRLTIWTRGVEPRPDRRGSWLRRLWRRLTGRFEPPAPPDPPDDEPALVPSGPPRGRPSLAAEADPPEPYEFEDHADHPRRDE